MASIPNIVVKLDASELNAAIERALSEVERRVNGEPRVDPVGLLAAGAVAAGSTRKFSRRGLLGLGWLKR